jgi:AAA family ATP:ADP antiporter
VTATLLRWLRLHDASLAERRATLWTAVAFFCVLFAYYLLRPLRENVAAAFDQGEMVWLFLLTFGLTTGLNQPYLALVRRLPSRRFLPYALHFFAASFLALAVVFAAGGAGAGGLGRLGWDSATGCGYAFFYSWVTAFSVCGVTLIWVHAVEWFSTSQGQRLFGLVSVGGTLGAVLGSAASHRLAGLGYSQVLLLSGTAVELAVGAWWLSLPWCRQLGGGEARLEQGPSFWSGLRQVLAVPYLRGIATFVLLSSISATTFYYQRVALVREQLFDDVARRAVEADINFWQNALCLLLQLFATSRVLLGLGTAVVLCVMPVGSLLGLWVFGLWPAVGVYALVEVLRRMLQFAFDKPAREVLYTPLDRQGKYVSKAVIDTAVMRLGDVVGALVNHAAGLLGVGGLGCAAAAMPLFAGWAWVGSWLGRRCRERAVGAAAQPRSERSQSSSR